MSRWVVLIGVVFGTGCLGSPQIPEVFITPVAPTTTDDLVADAVGGDIESFTYKWFQGDSARSDLQSATVSASETSKGEDWRVVAYQAEGSGWEPGIRMVTILNTPPVVTADTLSLIPEVGTATAFDDIQVTLNATDADDDTLEIDYAWSKDGEVQDELEEDTLPSSVTSRGETWTVTVTVSDGEADPQTESLDFPIGNEPPTLWDLRIGGDGPYRTESELRGVAATDDTDGDNVTVTWNWAVNGTSVQDGDSFLLSADFFVRGDVVTVTATPHDGFVSGDSETSAAVTIENTPPTVGTVLIDPTVIYRSTSVTCHAQDLVDPDGDDVTYHWLLTVNGVVTRDVSGEDQDLGFTEGGFNKHDELGCSVRADDGIEEGDSASCVAFESGHGCVAVLNSPPSGGSVTLAAAGGASPITTLVDLEATVTLPTDDDGDALILRYDWRTSGGGSIAGAGNQTTLLDSSLTSRADEIYLRLNISDGDTVDEGDIDVTSNTITIENSPPTWDGFQVNGQPSHSYGPVYTDTDLSLTAHNPYDADGDTIVFEWEFWNDLNGDGVLDWGESTIVSNAVDGYVFPSSLHSKGNSIQFYGSASDGSASTGLYGSWLEVVQNTPPDIGGVTIDPNPANKTETVTWVPNIATPADQDADGDAIQYDVEWEVNGIPAGTADTLDLSSWSKGDLVAVSVTPSDEDDTGTTWDNSLTISDAPPEITTVFILPVTAYTNDVLSAAVVTSDADNDAVRVFTTWKVGGTTVLTDEDAQLDGSAAFDRDQVVEVEVTPYNTDLSLAGTPITSLPLTISNTAPTTPQIAFNSATILEGVSEMRCLITAPSSDDDNDSVSYDFTWLVNGQPYNGITLQSFEPDDTIPTSVPVAGEEWTCEVSAFDGTAYSGAVWVSLTIAAPFTGWSPASQSLSNAADTIFYGDSSSDLLGWDVSFVGDVDGNGQEDVFIGAFSGEFGSTADAGSAHLWLGENLTQATNWSTTADYTLGSNITCGFGTSAQPAGDIDADGFADLLVTGPYCNSGANNNGVLYIVPATDILASTSNQVDVIAGNAWQFYGEASDSLVGWGGASSTSNSSNTNNQALHGGRDISGDGTPDLIIGSGQYNSNQGRSYVVLGESLGTPGSSSSLGTTSYIIDGYGGGSTGQEVELLPDIDGDGFAEFAIGGPAIQSAPRGGTPGGNGNGGAAFVFLSSSLPSPGSRFLTAEFSASVHLIGRNNAGGGYFGQSITGVEDMDGDGLAEVAVGAPWANVAGSKSGAIFVFTNAQINAADIDSSGSGYIESNAATYQLWGGGTYHELGADVSGAGDVDGDGLGDLLAGAESDYGTSHGFGGAYLGLAATISNNGQSQSMSTWADYSFTETTPDNHAFQVDGGTDFNNDGFDDLLVGAPYWDAPGFSNSGGAFLFLAP